MGARAGIQNSKLIFLLKLHSVLISLFFGFESHCFKLTNKKLSPETLILHSTYSDQILKVFFNAHTPRENYLSSVVRPHDRKFHVNLVCA